MKTINDTTGGGDTGCTCYGFTVTLHLAKAGSEEMRCLQWWPGERVKTINNTTVAEMLDTPTADAV